MAVTDTSDFTQAHKIVYGVKNVNDGGTGYIDFTEVIPQDYQFCEIHFKNINLSTSGDVYLRWMSGTDTIESTTDYYYTGIRSDSSSGHAVVRTGAITPGEDYMDLWTEAGTTANAGGVLTIMNAPKNDLHTQSKFWGHHTDNAGVVTSLTSNSHKREVAVTGFRLYTSDTSSITISNADVFVIRLAGKDF